ncbi:hypothetical protein [Streptomyces anandii]|uniref:Uncharacterized protein n=1 Tax=Streptomyces anandii TaxID=285454 RepID=A0ABW6H5C9_9ACTN
MTADPTRSRNLRYADEITSADVRTLVAFLNDRLRPHWEAAEGNREAWAVAHGLVGLVSEIHGILEQAVERRTGPEALVRRRAVRLEWNRLVRLARGWSGHDEYDHERWRQTPFLNPQEEAEWEEMRAQIIARAEAGEQLPGEDRATGEDV